MNVLSSSMSESIFYNFDHTVIVSPLADHYNNCDKYDKYDHISSKFSTEANVNIVARVAESDPLILVSNVEISLQDFLEIPKNFYKYLVLHA